MLLAACAPAEKHEPEIKEILRTDTDRFGLITCSGQTEDRTCYTHRTIIGVSMGASGAGQLGFSRPELFDTVGMLGVPLVDWVYMLRNFRRFYTGGFCDRDTILANLDQVATATGAAFCGPAKGTVKLEPSGQIMEADQDFNHWYRWVDNGRGGNFGRSKLRESFQDISLSYGNGLYYNPDSPYFPPGVEPGYRDRTDADRCSNPPVIRGLHHKEYNPDGSYPVIPVCDTRTNEGDFNPSRPSEVAFEMMLAVDYNGNNIRDYAEPVIVMAHERWEDVGAGASDRYDWDTNPAGKGDNWLYDDGESYEDHGLDGVPGTGDYGEGNGKFDYSPNVDNYLALNPRSLLETMPEEQLSRLNIWADAGIRDFLMSAGGTNWLWGALENRVGGGVAKDYTSFSSLVGGNPEYDFLSVDYSPEGIGRHAYLRYGDLDASETQKQQGDGHHVGTPFEVVNRFLTSLTFVQSRFYDPDIRSIDNVGDVNNLIKPKTYQSEILGKERKYGIVFPPGYDTEEHADQRYPVVYFLHGQGQESQDLLLSAILFFGYMAGSADMEKERARESDWAKFIIVFPDSECQDDDECESGNFNSNHPGLDGNGPKYMDALFELMAHVEKNFRTRVPVEVKR